jgi:hypothetical protein
MIKEGDKVICKKDHSFKQGKFIWSFTSGKEYEIKTLENKHPIYHYVYIKSDINFESYNHNGLRFALYEEIRQTKLFSDYFLTLAEWRQQQIDKILEE